MRGPTANKSRSAFRSSGSVPDHDLDLLERDRRALHFVLVARVRVANSRRAACRRELQASAHEGQDSPSPGLRRGILLGARVPLRRPKHRRGGLADQLEAVASLLTPGPLVEEPAEERPPREAHAGARRDLRLPDRLDRQVQDPGDVLLPDPVRVGIGYIESTGLVRIEVAEVLDQERRSGRCGVDSKVVPTGESYAGTGRGSARRRIHCSIGRPSPAEALADRSFPKTSPLRPFRQRRRHAAHSENMRCALVPTLLGARRPSTVLWLVIAVVVDPIDRVFRGRPRSHVL